MWGRSKKKKSLCCPRCSPRSRLLPRTPCWCFQTVFQTVFSSESPPNPALQLLPPCARFFFFGWSFPSLPAAHNWQSCCASRRVTNTPPEFSFPVRTCPPPPNISFCFFFLFLMLHLLSKKVSGARTPSSSDSQKWFLQL